MHRNLKIEAQQTRTAAVGADGLPAKFVNDRTVRPLVSRTFFNQPVENFDDSKVTVHTFFDGISVTLRKSPNFAACASFVTPKVEKLTNLFYRKSKLASGLNKAQFVHLSLIIDPIAVLLSSCLREQSNALIVPDLLCRNSGNPRRFTNVIHTDFLTKLVLDLPIMGSLSIYRKSRSVLSVDFRSALTT